MHTKSMLTLREISILTEPALGHLCYLLTDVPPQTPHLTLSLTWINPIKGQL